MMASASPIATKSVHLYLTFHHHVHYLFKIQAAKLLCKTGKCSPDMQLLEQQSVHEALTAQLQ